MLVDNPSETHASGSRALQGSGAEARKGAGRTWPGHAHAEAASAPPLTVVALALALLGVAAHSAWLSHRIDALEARGAGGARRWPSRSRVLSEGSGAASPLPSVPVSAGSPVVVPYESISDATWPPEPAPEDESQGVAVHVEQPGAAILMRAPIAPDWSGAPSPSASARPGAEMDLLVFATSMRAGAVSGNSPASNQSDWLSDPLGDGVSQRIVRAPHCRSLLSHHRCRALGQSGYYPQPVAGPLMPPLDDGVGNRYMPALAVAGDAMVLGRITSPTIDAIVETVAALRSQLLSLEASLEGESAALPTQSPAHASLPAAELEALADAGAELQLFAAASAANSACLADWNRTHELQVDGFADGGTPDLPTAPLLRNCGTVDYLASADSGLPMAALTGVPSEWGRVSANGIRLHSAVMVDVARAAAVPMARGARRFAWLYVTGGFDRQLCWAPGCDPNQAMAHAYRLDMVSLRWEGLPHLPMARARHGMAWLPELGLVAAGPGQAYGDWDAYRNNNTFARSLFEGAAEPFVDVLAVPEAFNATVQWSAPARRHPTEGDSLGANDKDFLYTSQGANNASGAPTFAVPSASWAASGARVSPLAWLSVGNLSEAFPLLDVSGITNASVTSIGTKVFLYGGGLAVRGSDDLRPQPAVLQVDLGHVRMTGGGLRANVTLLCSTPESWLYSAPLIGGALFPAPAGNRLLAFGGHSLGYAASLASYDITMLDGTDQYALVIDLDSAGGGAQCNMLQSDASRDNWSGFGATRLANGHVIAAGGSRHYFPQEEGELYRLFDAETSFVTPVDPVTEGRGVNFAALPVVSSTHRLMGGVMAAMPAVPVASGPGAAELIARLDMRDANGTRLRPAAPWQAASLTQELWWFGGDPIEESYNGYTMSAATGAYLRRLGGDWSCGELGAARREVAASAQGLHAVSVELTCQV